MTQLKCIIVEDEPLAQQVLQRYISDHEHLHLIKVCKNALYGFSILKEQLVDVMFLDINMPLISGIDFLKTLEKPPKVILTTAYPDYAAESYELDVFDYLLKPFTFDRFKKSINKLMMIEETKLLDAEPEYIFIKVDGRLVKINHVDILYIEAMGDYLKVKSIQRTYITHMTMKVMEELLPPNKFIRVQRSFIIAKSKVTTLGSKYVQINEIEIRVGELYREKLKACVLPVK
ncbi:MAG: LytR/AlgR family response regulator transcription factor [Chitinophagaceae bacterium]